MGTSDDFASATLDGAWSVEGPAGISHSLDTSATDAFLSLMTPDGDYDVYNTNNGARAMQATADTDFQIETRFLTTPTEKYQLQGLLVEQDADNWLRFDTYSDGRKLYAYGAFTVDGVTTKAFRVRVPGDEAPYLRVTRSGDDWTLEYSTDGSGWTIAGSFTHALNVTQTGVFAGNTGSATGFTAQVDYFENTADPIVDEDGTIVPVNNPPDAVDDGLVTDEDVALVIDPATDLLANDSDPNGDPISLTDITQPANGSLTDNGDGTYTYTPAAGFSGNDSFTYTISDGSSTDTATVTITVSGPPPASGLASDDFAAGVLDPVWSIQGPSGISSGFGTNASDAYLELVTPDGDYDVYNTNNGARAMQATADTDFQIETRFLTTPTEKYQLQGLLVEQDADNWLRFDTYSDGRKLYAYGAFTVDGVTTKAFRVRVPGDEAPYLRVTRSGDDWTLEYSTDGSGWTIAGSFTHALNVTQTGVFAGNTGSATGFTAQVDYFENTADPIVDEDGTIVPVNNPPDAVDDGLVTDEDVALVIDPATDLLANDSDPNGDPISLTDITQPANGSLTDNGDGTYTYTPAAGFSGNDSFTYTISDGSSTDTATVTITVSGPPPASGLASDDFAAGVLDPVWSIQGPSGISSGFGTNASDAYLELVTPDGDYDVYNTNNGARAMQATADTDFQIETRFLTTPTEKYQLQGLLVEQDADNWLRFDTYSDGSNLRAFGAITVNGNSSAQFNTVIPGGNAPYMRLDRAGDVWTFEYSVDGNTWVTAGSFTHALNVTQTGVFAGNTGSATGFTAQVDYFENTADPITDEDGTIVPVNNPPDAVDDGLVTDEDVALVIDPATDLLANDSDPNGDPISLTDITQPANGSLTDNGDGTYTYTPAAGFSGNDSFTYTISDGSSTDTATVTITVSGPPPASGLASDDFAAGVLDPVWSIQGPSGISSGFGTNASDAYLELVTPDGDYDVYNTNNGARAMQATADTDFQIETRFLTTPTEKYQLQGLLVEQDADNWLRFDTYSDGSNLRAFGAITVNGNSSAQFNTVIPGGNAPYMRLDRAGDVWTFEYSVDGNTWVTAGSFTHALNVTQTGVFAGNTGSATGFTAQVDYFENTADPITDEDGTIVPVNNPPDAVDDGLVTDEDVALVIDPATDLLANDSDPNGDPISLTDITQPANGSLTDNGDGTYTYTPAAGFSGNDSFTYTISDGSSTDTATVNVTVSSDTPSPTSDIVSDDFAGGSLDPVWTYSGVDGFANLATTTTDGFLEIHSPEDVPVSASDTLTTPRVLQSVSDQDFQISAGFLNEPTEAYQEHGLLVIQDDGNWIRFDLAYTSSGLRLIVGLIEGGSTSYPLFQGIGSGLVSEFKITRVGDSWTFEYSADGVNWTEAFSVEHSISVSQVGVFAGSTTKNGAVPGFTAQVDYFENTADPITDEDGTIVPVNTAPVAGDDDLMTDQDVPLSVDVASDLLDNDSDANGDTLSLDNFTQPANGALVDNGDGTLSYTTDAGYNGVDSFTYTVTDGSLTDTATVNVTVGTPPGPISDDFSAATLDGAWSVEGPAGISHSLDTSATDAFLSLVTPDGNHDAWNTNNTARAMQVVANADFAVEARFLTTPTEKYQLQGFLVEQDADNWLRFDTYSTGSKLYAFAAITVNGSSSPAISVQIPEGTAPYLRLDRSGDAWTFEYSQDGTNWVTAGSFTQSLAVTSAGVFAGNTGQATGFTAEVDYVEFASDPIADEDGTYEGYNVAPVANDDLFVVFPDTVLTFDAADLLANDTDLNEDVLTVTDVGAASVGSLVDNGDGTYTYTPSQGYEGDDTFDYMTSDGEFTDTGTVTLEVGHPIDLWHGNTQRFGSPGEGQKWINILGNVAGEVTSLSYTLNGGPAQALSLGPDDRRLQSLGDFNIDIAYSALDDSAAHDLVEISATYADGSVWTDQVTIDYESGFAWPKDYSIDWETVTDIQDVVQVADGKWEEAAAGARPVETGYDRLLVLGDQSWDNYQLDLTITMHDITVNDPVGVLEGFAIGMLWGGHTETGTQPHHGYEPGASFFYTQRFKSHSYHEFSELLAVQDYDLEEGLTYNFTVRVEQVGVYDRLYSLKAWEVGTAEPMGWTIQGLETFSIDEAPATGSIYLLAHYYDVTFGDLTVTEITGSDIVQGTDGADVLSAVDAALGVDEIDVFTGGAGADTFVFGDTGGAYYDDGNAVSSGAEDYGFVWDFVSGTDSVELWGSTQDYVLSEDAAGLPAGTAVWRVATGEQGELVAVLNGVYGLDLNSGDFIFTDLDPFA